MAQGALWNTQFQGNQTNIRKGLYGSALVRDYNLSATSLTGFTPFNPSDGNLITNLFSPTFPGGPWSDFGYLDEKGPMFSPKLTTELTKVMQTRRPVRADYTEDAEEISFTLMEGSPLVDYMVQNKPISAALTITAPTGVAVVPSATGGSFAAGSYFWVVTFTNSNGETTRSNEATATLTGSTSSVLVEWNANINAGGARVYRGTTTGNENFLVGTVAAGATTFTDTGAAGTSATPPTTNTAAIPSVPSVGTENFAVGRPVELDIVYRQMLMIAIDNTSANAFYMVRLYPRVVLTDIGKRTWNAKTPDSIDVKFQSFDDPWTISPDGIAGSPIIIYRDGPAWRAAGGPTSWPIAQIAPVATAGATHTFTLVFQQPTTPNQPFTYAVTQTTGGTPSASTLTSVVTNATGQVTITGAALIATDAYTFTVIATGANGVASVPSLVSNSITAT